MRYAQRGGYTPAEQQGGAGALRSKGPVSRERLSPQQWARLEAELEKGPLAHGFAGVACYRLPGPGHRPPITACQPRLWGWDNLNIHLAPELADFAAENKAWLRVYGCPRTRLT
jgi:hypothetical protein